MRRTPSFLIFYCVISEQQVEMLNLTEYWCNVSSSAVGPPFRPHTGNQMNSLSTWSPSVAHWTSALLFKQRSIYEENLVAIQLQKNKVILNKPRYIGMTILDISKLIMYQFHYEYMMQKYPEAKLLFTDTDSFCYWIPTETNVYDDICGNSEWFDFSNYPVDHKNYDNDKNNLIPGKMKDEMGGELILEFVGLRAKMYSILNYNGENKRTAKGVIEQVKKKQIQHEDYKTSLFNSKTFVHCGSKIQQDKHQLYTVDITKVTLSPFNDKKWITRDGETFQSYSFGNILIPRKHEC